MSILGGLNGMSTGSGMTTARDRGWGDPSIAGYRKNHIVTIDAGGVRLAVRREAASLFKGFIEEITRRGFDISGRADDWGFAYRPVRGYEAKWNATHDLRYLSNHSWGLAVDLNAQDHPLGRRGTGVPRWVVEEARRWGLSWGGDYQGRPDEMHFEVLLTPAQVAELVRNITTTPPPAPQPPSEDDMIVGYDKSPEDEARATVRYLCNRVWGKGQMTAADQSYLVGEWAKNGRERMMTLLVDHPKAQ